MKRKAQRAKEMLELADKFTKWVEQYATRVCPPGFLPLPAQEQEISLFAEVAATLRLANPSRVSHTMPFCTTCTTHHDNSISCREAARIKSMPIRNTNFDLTICDEDNTRMDFNIFDDLHATVSVFADKSFCEVEQVCHMTKEEVITLRDILNRKYPKE